MFNLYQMKQRHKLVHCLAPFKGETLTKSVDLKMGWTGQCQYEKSQTHS